MGPPGVFVDEENDDGLTINVALVLVQHNLTGFDVSHFTDVPFSSPGVFPVTPITISQ